MDTLHLSRSGPFRTALELVPDAVVVVDDKGRIVAANAQVAGVFGHSASDLEGQLVDVLVPERARAGDHGLRIRYTPRPTRPTPLTALRRDGTEFPAEVSLASIGEAAAPLTVVTIRDIGDRVRREHEADRLRDDLLATVSHELRTPLTSIIGSAELMEDLPDTEVGPRARRFLDVITRNAERELRLVNDLLAVAVDSLDQPGLDLSPVDVASLVEETVRLRREQALERGLTLTADVSAAVGSRAQGEARRLVQVFDNLINNAMKFTRPGGRITIVVLRDEHHVAISVADTGIGIGVDDHTRVFERLYRSSNAVRSETPGVGLGLAISKSIVDAHAGRISLTSDLDQGTVVTVLIPVTHDRVATPATAS